MIQVVSAGKTIRKKEVLSEITCEFHAGECVALKGPNGSGKTMLLRLLCGLIEPTRGSVEKDPDLSFGVIIETPAFLEHESGLANLRYLASLEGKIGDEVIFEYLRKFDLFDVKDKAVRTYSLGMRQRLALCQAFMEDPDVLLLDEPFNALDDTSVALLSDVLEKAKENGKLIVLATHGLIPEACPVDRILRMNEGRLLDQ